VTAQSHQDIRDRVAREDLVLFINACFSATGQSEFYDSLDDDSSAKRPPEGRKSVTLDFLHDYIRGNHRLLYARTLAIGVNHHNMQRIIGQLLSTGKDVDGAQRAEEGALIQAALRALPPQRALAALEQLVDRGTTNRRFRAVLKSYLASRADFAFDAVKYRRRLRRLAVHAHLKFDDERATFLFAGYDQRSYTTPLFETFRAARHSKDAVYQLPFAVAEGFAATHGIPRDVFLQRMQKNMTRAEKLKFQDAARDVDVDIDVDLSTMPLTKLWLYVLSLDRAQRETRRDELQAAIAGAALRTWKRAPLPLDHVAVVADTSHSMSGSLEKKRRPLAVSLGVLSVLRASGATLHTDIDDELMMVPSGQTALGKRLLDAMASGASMVIVVSDAVENDPKGAVNEIVRVARTRVPSLKAVSVLHLNPVFSPGTFTPETFGSHVPTIALRDAEDLATALGFARFASGATTFEQLQHHMAARVERFLQGAA
jgi:hypothetical protein